MRELAERWDMQALIWAGAALTVIGLIGLGYCILRAVRARRSGLDGAAMRAELQRVVAINLAAVGVSALGLAAVVAGILLG
jgi:energy-converting hydrogenase Eha subunit E